MYEVARRAEAAAPTYSRSRGTDPRSQSVAGAVLLMTFEPDTFTSKDGKMYVADLSGLRESTGSWKERRRRPPVGLAPRCSSAARAFHRVLPRCVIAWLKDLKADNSLSVLGAGSRSLNGDSIDVQRRYWGWPRSASRSYRNRLASSRFVLPENRGSNTVLPRRWPR